MKSKLLLVTLLLAGWASLSGAHAADRKPNFLFVYTDDQRWDAMGVVQREMGERGRYPWFTTPAMDRIAAEGVRFRNAFVTLSLCAPSRAAFLTGRYNHLNGVANNHTPFPETSVTHATLLRAAGYTTGYIGKWHMGSQRGQRPGFDYSASFVGQGRYVDCPIEVNGEVTPSNGWVDDVSTDYAIAFMKQHRDQPFSLVVGFKACHGPTTPPERAANRFAGAKARRVPNLGLRAPFRDEADIPATKAAPADGNDVAVNLNYFRCVSAADDNLGRLLDALDQLGLAQDTVVVFTSDNGYYQGEHSLGDKRSLYDESLRIPMIVRYPRAFPKGGVTDAMVLNVDLAPTLLDFAGVAVPKEMQGRSWRPLFTSAGPVAGAPWRSAFFCEYFQEAGYPNTPTMTAVRTTDAKLIKYTGHDDWTELFDLAADPYETKNLARDPSRAALLARLNAEFDREANAVAFAVPAYADDPNAPGETAGKKKGKNKKKGE
ncbi:MAG: sulfatase [Verrucomicrobia bacterium]|nr:sulfatase [Verrucomicrobiota bacterium]